jgi:hypothetical protein
MFGVALDKEWHNLLHQILKTSLEGRQ